MLTPSELPPPLLHVVSWAAAAMGSSPTASDDELIDLLVANGRSRPAAARACTMLPLAFGRHVLRDLVTLPDGYVERDAAGAEVHHAALAADPFFRAASALAEAAGHDQIQAIALRSAEVKAVNQALNAGAAAADLVLSPPIIWGAAAAPWDDEIDARRILEDLLRSHGSRLACDVQILPRTLTATHARLQLDIGVVAPALGDRVVIESFAGGGATIRAATAEAIQKFAQGSLHVLMATLEHERLGADQVEWETWGRFRVCLGPLLRHWATVPAVDFGAYLEELRSRLLAEPLTAELHWHRTFVGFERELLGHDALLDNQQWPAGDDLVTGWPWPRAERAYGLRLLLMMVPVA